MLNDHTASKGALTMTSCLDRNGGRKTCLHIPCSEKLSEVTTIAAVECKGLLFPLTRKVAHSAYLSGGTFCRAVSVPKSVVLNVALSTVEPHRVACYNMVRGGRDR